MEFWSVYKLGDSGGAFGLTYFVSQEKADKFYREWREEEPWSTILMDYEYTED